MSRQYPVTTLATIELAKLYHQLCWKLFIIGTYPHDSWQRRFEHEPTANEMTECEEELVKRAVAKDRVACIALSELNISTQFYFWANTPNHPDDEISPEPEQAGE